MEAIVADASVVAKWYVEEEHSNAARELLAPGFRINAPDLLPIEIDNMLCTWLRRRSIDREKADIIRAALRTVPIEMHTSAPLREAAFLLAASAGITMYDALYVALAGQLGAELVTADERLVRALAGTRFARRVISLRSFARRR
jgi:predicted nucleic acid-binding protein